MANNVIKRLWNQNRMVTIEDLKGMTFQQEVSGHTFEITGVDDAGNIIALSGTPSGVLLRADDQEVALTCSVSDGKVYATIPANGYAVPGKFGLTVFLTASGQTTALYAAIGSVNRTASGIVAPPAGSDVATLINQINAAIAAIPVNYNAAIAPPYSTTSLYGVGQYVTESGTLYRCITPVTTAGTWDSNSSKFTAATLGTDLSDLKSALGVSETTPTIEWTPNHGIFAGGQILPNNGSKLSQAISVREGDNVEIKTAIYGTMEIAVFRSNNSFLKAWVKSDGTSIGGDDYYRKFIISCPADSAYIRFTCLDAYAAAASISVVDTGLNDKIDRYYDSSNAGKFILVNDSGVAGLSEEQYGIFDEDVSPIWKDNWMVSNGTLEPNEYFAMTQFIPFKAGMTAKILTAISGTAQIGIFNDKQVFIEGYVQSDGTSKGNGMYYFEIDASQTTGASYIAVSCLKDKKSYYSFSLSYALPTIYRLLESKMQGENTLKDKKILVFGDSISDNTYHGATGSNWNKWASYLANKYGFTLTLDAIHATGFVADTSTVDHSKTLVKRVVNYNGTDNEFDMIVIFMGINDFMQSVPFGTATDTDKTTYCYPAMTYCLDYLIEQFPNATILGVSPMQAGPLWISPSDIGNLMTYTDKIIQVYNTRSVPCIDMLRNGGFRVAVSDDFVQMFTLLANNGQGQTVHDGLHPNELWDHNYLAPRLYKFMCENMNTYEPN